MGDILSNVGGKLYLGGMYVGDVIFAEEFMSSAKEGDTLPEYISSENVSWKIGEIKIINQEEK
jgi:hypothetical protein